MLRLQPFVISLLFLSTEQAACSEVNANAFSEPTAAYLRTFVQSGRKTFVLERFDAEGRLTTRTLVAISGDIAVTSATARTIAGYHISLRGLDPCPSPRVFYNRVQTWTCTDAARDYAGTIYNRRASVILCKTLLLRSGPTDVVPASCYALVGGADGEAWRSVNDDDSMVFLGLAKIGQTEDGRSRRPDLEASQILSQSMGFSNAD